MENERPFITIITATYNSAVSVVRAINSVMNQTNFYEGFEHIIVDGCSTDNTISTLRNFPHLKIISEPDDGIYDAMNKGIRIARGKYIGILNSDDWYVENLFSMIYKTYLEDNDIGVIHGDMSIWMDNEQYHIQKYKSHQKYYCMWIRHPTCFVKKEVYEHYGIFNLKYHIQADYDLMLRFKNAGVKFYYLSGVLTNFSLGGASQTRWTLKESLSVRRDNGWSFIRAFITAISVRSLFVGRIIIYRSIKYFKKLFNLED